LAESSKPIRARFWLEIGVAGTAAALAVLTLVWSEWIEAIFRMDPDRGNGSLERSIVGVLLLISLTLSVASRRERRRAVIAALSDSSGS
jgi:hypothetical protein